ncbi:DUF5677 domain-containing protein [Microcoleus anatoxicus]|uniref:DUF5677 domain-containing protein n=1 Tax=Microcoleus anatoxicus PTRS2 TaxID=2705321 RepID=A0ABU8YPV2_9CYAN
MSSQVEELLHQVHEFVTDFIIQIKVSKSEYSVFSSCLRASLAKSYEFLLFSHRDAESEGYFFAVSTLRGITEDLIVLKFISKLDYTKRERLLQGLQLIEVHERMTRQQAFFEKYRPFQPVLGWTDTSPSLDQLESEIQTIWSESGWTNFRKKGIPPVRDMAAKLAPGILDLLYDFIYRLTSSTVHFTPQTLLRLGWGLIEEGGNSFSGGYSVKHLTPYYKKFCQIYGGLLFCLYFEFFEHDMILTTTVKNIISSIREAILLDNRWPEMITFEEMNKAVPQFYHEQPILYATMHAAVIEKFREGFIV